MKAISLKILLVFMMCASLSACSDPADTGSRADTRDENDVGKDATDASEQDVEAREDAESDAQGGCVEDRDCVHAPHQVGICDTSQGICVYACDDGFDNCDGDINTGCEADLSRSTDHCGECGNYCSPTSLSLRPVCIVEDNQAARCDLDVDHCAEGFVDVNKLASDGCECEITDENDLPDPQGIDENCDGLDGVKDRAVYVAGDGSTGDVGEAGASGLTPEAPVNTIAEGLRIAASQGRDYVLVAAGLYPEVVELRSGIGIYGGYTYAAADGDTPASWTRGGEEGGVDAALTRIAPSATDIDDASNRPLTYYRTLIATDISNRTVLGGLTIVGMDATTPGASSTALWAKNAEGIVLQNSTVSAGKGADGAHGDAGLTGEERADQGLCTPFSGGAPGVDAPVTPCANDAPLRAAPGMQGGPTDTTSGAPGGDGGEGGRHACQEKAENCGTISGNAGQPGSVGQTGEDGRAPTSSMGEFNADGWVLPNAQAAEAGRRGRAGGGGGAGGRCEYYGECGPLNINCSKRGIYNGGNGGRGGNGGCGGGPGENGQSGGAAFGVVAINSPLTFVGARITLGMGGNGGDGGPGGEGAAGGSGTSGTGGQDQFGGDGGTGGDGGMGGAGGNGAGGCGAPSIGLALLDTFVDQAGLDITTSTGSAGSPGHGAGGADDGCAGTLKAFHNFTTQ